MYNPGQVNPLLRTSVSPFSSGLQFYFTFSKVPSSPQSLTLCFSLSTLSCMFLPYQLPTSKVRDPPCNLGHSPSPPYPTPRDHNLHPDFCTQEQSQVKEDVSHPRIPLPLKPEHYLCSRFSTGPCISSGAWNARLCLFSSCFIFCLCCSSGFRPKFHLPLHPLASGKLASFSSFLFNCLWPNKGEHGHTVHSSSSSLANATRLLSAPKPASAHDFVFLLQH